MENIAKIEDAAERLRQTAQENGGPYEEPQAYRGSCARTMFDKPGSRDGTITALVPEQEIHGLAREHYVRIDSVHPRTGEIEGEYVGVVSSGPFAEPDALGATAPTLVVAAAHGAVLTPRYHGIAEIELLGERSGGVLIPAMRRPCPNSPIFRLDDDAVASVLGLNVAPSERPCRLGLLEGTSTLSVALPAATKSVLFKHLAILGTTGGGKSTTVSGTVMKLAEEGNAVILLDVEGEYASMHAPTDNPRMLAALAKRGLDAKGSPNTQLFHLTGRKPADPGHPNKKAFKIGFDELSPFLLAEVLDLSEPQSRRLLDAHDICRKTMERLKLFPSNDQEQQQALEIDELSSGWPRMTLDMLLDVINAAISLVDKDLDNYEARFAPDFKQASSQIRQLVAQQHIEGDKKSWLGLAKRLWRMRRAGIFSKVASEQLDPAALVKAGTISIIDLSDMDAPYLRNLVIAQVLRSVQEHQDKCYKALEGARTTGHTSGDLTRVNIFIEEAHEFLSRERIRQMPNLFDQVARIARRGRKRYLGLAFVTQLPSHLPDEVFGLVNNWILHKLTDENVIARLRKVVTGVNTATWGSMPNLAPGQALCSFTHLSRRVMVSIDPSPCRLRMVD